MLFRSNLSEKVYFSFGSYWNGFIGQISFLLQNQKYVSAYF